MNLKPIFLKILSAIPIALFTLAVLFLLDYTRPETPETAGTISSVPEPLPEEDLSCSVSFSHPSGFYPNEFLLDLSAPEGFTIYYTLDGSIPDTSSTRYTKSLAITNVSGEKNKYANQTGFSPHDTLPSDEPIEKAYIIRAVGIDDRGVTTEAATGTYFVGYGKYYENTSVLSIVSDPGSLFDEDTGIYVLGKRYQDFVAGGGNPEDDSLANYRQHGRTWERPAHIDFFGADKEYLFSQEAGIRINGNSSRGDSRKSLRLYARKEYDGNSRFLFPFFEEKKYPKSIILRRGSFENQFLPSLVYDRHIGTEKYLPCVVFLDGEFWGFYYLLERYDKSYVENHYYVDADNVTIIKDGTLLSGSQLISDSYDELRLYMHEHDLSVPENYEYVCTQMDMQSYIDYYCTQIYLNNYDFSESKNNVFWRSNRRDEGNPNADTRWHWALLDLDFALTAYGNIENYTTNTFCDTSGHAVARHTQEIMFGALLANPDFRQQFVTTFMDLENVNFNYDTVCKKIDDVSSLVEDGTVWKEFFEKRPAYINNYLAETFHLTGTLVDVTLEINDASAGEIRLNTVTPDLTAGTWTGNYYTDYPVTVMPLPKEGFQFKNWVVNGLEFSDTELTIPLTKEDTHIYAVFEPVS